MKQFLTILLVIVLAAVVSTLTTFYFLNKNTSVMRPKQKPTNAVKASPKPTAMVKDDTTNWKSYSNSKWEFSLKYDPSWLKAECDNGTSFFLFLAATNDALGKCNSGFGGQMSVFVQNGDHSKETSLSAPDYVNISTQNVTVDGVNGQRISGEASNDGFQTQKGQKVVYYIFFTNSKTYRLNYVQAPSGTLSTDLLSKYDLMARNTLKFSAK